MKNWRSTISPKNPLIGITKAKAQNDRNVALVEEYQTADRDRRGEIFEEYYRDNRKWICSWHRWPKKDWGELTQIFVSYWHEAFMKFKNINGHGVVNVYLDRCYKAKSSNDYKSYIEKGRRLLPEACSDFMLPKEFLVNPQSEYDKACLRDKLCRSLDAGGAKALLSHVYEEKMWKEVAAEERGVSFGSLTPYERNRWSLLFKRDRLDKLIRQVSSVTSAGELRELANS